MRALDLSRLLLRVVLAAPLLFSLQIQADDDVTETEPPLDSPSLWVKSFETRFWSGYKDNVLLSPQKVVTSALVAGSFDAMIFRLPVDGWESLFLISGDYTRYLNAPEVDQEATAIAQGQVSRTFAEGWKTGLSAEYLYLNQVFDATTFEDTRQSIQVQGHSFTLRPSVSKQLPKAYRLELEVPATRQLFAGFIDDYWEFGPKLTFGREFGKRADLALSYQFSDRLHDNREARDQAGLRLPGHTLEFYQHELSAAWRQSWDQARRWRSTTRVSVQQNDDNGGGYYDYVRPQLSEQLRYQTGTWALRAEARLAHYFYDHQRIDDARSAIREKTYLRFNVQAERAVTKQLKVFAQYEHERSVSNLASDEYLVNVFTGGIDWEF